LSQSKGSDTIAVVESLEQRHGFWSAIRTSYGRRAHSGLTSAFAVSLLHCLLFVVTCLRYGLVSICGVPLVCMCVDLYTHRIRMDIDNSGVTWDPEPNLQGI
jgi:hypothetical protein